jgi:hypothetical protein
MPLKHLQHVQHPPIYFYNIKMKQLQHTSEMSETLKTYICNIEDETYKCNIEEVKAGPVNSGRGVGAGGEPWLTSTTSTGRTRGCP